MDDVRFQTLRDLVLYHAAHKGWTTQRRIAVECGIDETALSRLLNGEQDIGAHRTHALFRAVGIPVDQYNLAYALLGRVQQDAQASRTYRPARGVAVLTPSIRERVPAPMLVPRRPRQVFTPTVPPIWPGSPRPLPAGSTAILPSEPATSDLPAAFVIAIIAAQHWTGEEIAAFFGG